MQTYQSWQQIQLIAQYAHTQCNGSSVTYTASPMIIQWIQLDSNPNLGIGETFTVSYAQNQTSISIAP